MAGKFYAVKEGRSTGVFASWAECKKQVDGYSGAKYKSFTSMQDATAYLMMASRVKMHLKLLWHM